MNIDKFLKEQEIVVNDYNVHDDDTFHIKWRVLKNLLEKYHQSKVKENELLHSVSGTCLANKSYGDCEIHHYDKLGCLNCGNFKKDDH